jgi:hypothetical protein
MEMPSENEVIATFAHRFPDSRIVCAQDANIPVGNRRSIRPGDRNHAIAVIQSSNAIMDPFPSAAHDCLTHAMHPDMTVVVAPHRQHGCHFAKRANQIAQLVQFRRPIHQVAPQQHRIRFRMKSRFEHLSAEKIGTLPTEMNIADIHHTTRIIARRKAFFAEVKGST